MIASEVYEALQLAYWRIINELVCCTPDMECHERHDMCKYATWAANLVLNGLEPDEDYIGRA